MSSTVPQTEISIVSVVIIVGDANDNSPVWTSSFPAITLPEVRKTTCHILSLTNSLTTTWWEKLGLNLFAISTDTANWNRHFHSFCNGRRFWFQWKNFLLHCVSSSKKASCIFCKIKCYNFMSNHRIIFHLPLMEPLGSFS